MTANALALPPDSPTYGYDMARSSFGVRTISGFHDAEIINDILKKYNWTIERQIDEIIEIIETSPKTADKLRGLKLLQKLIENAMLIRRENALTNVPSGQREREKNPAGEETDIEEKIDGFLKDDNRD